MEKKVLKKCTKQLPKKDLQIFAQEKVHLKVLRKIIYLKSAQKSVEKIKEKINMAKKSAQKSVKK